MSNTTTTRPPTDERDELRSALGAVRSAIVAATADLDDEQLGRRSTASALTLGALIKHLAFVEERWMAFVVDGPSAMSYELPAGVSWEDMAAGTATEYPGWAMEHQSNLQMLPDDTGVEILARYERVAAHTARVIGSADLSASHPLPAAPWLEPGAYWSARRVLLQVISETAQHAGHADIIRESIDGRTAG